MKEMIKLYIDNAFSSYPDVEEVNRVKEDLRENMEEKFDELVLEGKKESVALATVIEEFGEVDDLEIDVEKPNEPEETTESESYSYDSFKNKSFDKLDRSLKKKKISWMIWGSCLILAATLIMLNKIFKTTIFTPFIVGDMLDNWWALFLIVPGISGLIAGHNKVLSLILLLLGLWLLFDSPYFFNTWLGLSVWNIVILVAMFYFGIKLIKKSISFRPWKNDFTFEPYDGNDISFSTRTIDLTTHDFSNEKELRYDIAFSKVTILMPNNINVNIVEESAFTNIINNHRNIPGNQEIDLVLDIAFSTFIVN